MKVSKEALQNFERNMQLVKRVCKPIATEVTRQEVLASTGIDIANYVRIVSHDEATQQSAVLVCGDPDIDLGPEFTANVHTHCSFCGKGVTHRPNVPLYTAWACIECALQRGILHHAKTQGEA